jgi:hypothetical protein
MTRARRRVQHAIDLLGTYGLAGDRDAVARAWRELVLAAGDLERDERREADAMIAGAMMRPVARGRA